MIDFVFDFVGGGYCGVLVGRDEIMFDAPSSLELLSLLLSVVVVVRVRSQPLEIEKSASISKLLVGEHKGQGVHPAIDPRPAALLPVRQRA